MKFRPKGKAKSCGYHQKARAATSTRSSGPNCQAAPCAPTWWTSSAIVASPIARPSAKNGASSSSSRRSSRPRFQSSRTASTAGSVTVAVLARTASANSASDSAHAPRPPAAGRGPALASALIPAWRRKASAAAKNRTADSTFRRSVIHATDSTLIGWATKNAAPSHAAGTASRRSTRQSRIPAAACSSRLTARKPGGQAPQARVSSQNEV